MDWYMAGAFLAYLLALLVIGLVAAKKSEEPEAKEGESSFILGGRSLNYWVAALSAHASDMSNWIFMGYPVAIYSGGLINAWTAIGLVGGMWASWHFIAPKLRVMTEEFGCYTLASFFERRFHDDTGIIRLVLALMSVLFFLVYVSVGLFGIGAVLESAFNIPYALGIALGISVILIYTFVGGYVAVAWIDFFQAIFLLSALLIVPLVAFTYVNGFQGIATASQAKDISFSLLPSYSLATIGKALMIALGWGLGYLGMPHVLNKFMGLKDPREMHKSKYVGMTWQVLLMAAATFVGLVAIPFFPFGLAKSEYIFLLMVKMLFWPMVGGLILCGILAATISTLDSQIIVLAGIISEDVYKNVVRRDASVRQVRVVYQASIVAIALIGFVIALGKVSTIYDLVWYAWAGLGSLFGPLVLTALYYKKANKYGAIAGVITGGVLSALWKPYLNNLFFHFELSGMIPGFFGSLLMIYLVSFLTRNEKE